MTTAPTPENYAAWVQARLKRTQDIMNSQQVITGRMIHDMNLSARAIYDAGWWYDSAADSLRKPS